MSEQQVRVQCYAGYRGEERPLRFAMGENWLEVATVEDRWYSPGATYFRVVVTSGERYVLRRHEGQDVWFLSAFRASSPQAIKSNG